MKEMKVAYVKKIYRFPIFCSLDALDGYYDVMRICAVQHFKWFRIHRYVNE